MEADAISPDASITVKGIVKLNNTLTSTSITEAASANAVKMVNDKVLDTGWITLAANSGWNSTATFRFLQYRKVGNVVYVRGSVVPSAGYNNTIGSLPSGFRPRSTIALAISVDSNTSYPLLIGNTGVILLLSAQHTSLVGKEVGFETSFIQQS